MHNIIQDTMDALVQQVEDAYYHNPNQLLVDLQEAVCNTMLSCEFRDNSKWEVLQSITIAQMFVEYKHMNANTNHTKEPLSQEIFDDLCAGLCKFLILMGHRTQLHTDDLSIYKKIVSTALTTMVPGAGMDIENAIAFLSGLIADLNIHLHTLIQKAMDDPEKTVVFKYQYN